MITTDPRRPQVATGPSAEIATYLEALTAGSSRPEADVPASLSDAFARILAEAAGTVELTLGSPTSRQGHNLILSRHGVLRVSHGTERGGELAVHPTNALPGVLLRLCRIAPTEPLGSEHTIAAPEEGWEALLAGDAPIRDRAWSQVAQHVRALPLADPPALECTAPWFLELRRVRPQSEKRVRLALLRGRFLADGPTALADGDGDGAPLRGVSPTEASRALMACLL